MTSLSYCPRVAMQFTKKILLSDRNVSFDSYDFQHGLFSILRQLAVVERVS